MSQIIYPTLDLYLYDLHYGLGQDSEVLKNNQNNFIAKLSLDNSLNFQNIVSSFQEFDSKKETEYRELLDQKRIEFQSFSQPYFFKGYYYPVQLNDTYGLLIDCSIENDQNIPSKTRKNPYPIDCFTTLKNYINIKRNSQASSIGETWMLSGELPKDCTEKPEEVAQKCYQALIPGAKWENNIQGQGKLLGGVIFELWGYPAPDILSPNSLQEKHHVIIALYSNADSAREASELNYSWLRLFCYRNKILWSYTQSQNIKFNLKADFNSIYQQITKLQEANQSKIKLIQVRPFLSQAQKLLSRYSLKLSDFEYQTRNLEINLYNYKKRLEYMINKSNTKFTQTTQLKNQLSGYLSSSSDLSFLEKFSIEVSEKFLLQMRKDYENFSPGEKLIEGLMNSINSVKTLIEIEQVERDRAFQNNIAILGIGAGVSSIVASASASYTETIQEWPWIKNYLNQWQLNEQSSNFVISINFSFFIGVLVALVTTMIIKVGELIRAKLLRP